MPPIPIYFLDANCAFRTIVVAVLRLGFSADITLIGTGDTWPIPACAAALPEVPILVLGHLDDTAYRVAAMAAGAAAFRSKDALATKLVPTLRGLTSIQRAGV
ncbi:MAG: hypothetical protein WCG26_06185 [Chloroflexales bacterium]